MEIGFSHGVLCDSYEEQANKQGYTLRFKAKNFEQIKSSYNTLRINGYLTDSQADTICKKIQKRLVKNLIPLDK